jgi:hypothetical protein
MRDFFKRELETLYAKTQLRQYETLSAMDDPQKQIKVLLDTLQWACDRYDYIPDATKQAIILERMLTDGKFIGFNAPVLIKWFEEVKGIYFKESAHIKPEDEAPPVAYEDLKPELKQEVDNLLKELSEPSKFAMPAITQADLKSIEIEDELKQGESMKPKGSNENLVIIHEKKMQAIKSRGLDTVDFRDLKKFEINGIIIHARNEEEANDMFVEIYVCMD